MIRILMCTHHCGLTGENSACHHIILDIDYSGKSTGPLLLVGILGSNNQLSVKGSVCVQQFTLVSLLLFLHFLRPVQCAFRYVLPEACQTGRLGTDLLFASQSCSNNSCLVCPLLPTLVVTSDTCKGLFPTFRAQCCVQRRGIEDIAFSVGTFTLISPVYLVLVSYI